MSRLLPQNLIRRQGKGTLSSTFLPHNLYFAEAAAAATGLAVTQDATSKIYLPQSWTEWQAMLTASNLTSANAPIATYLCQETTGSAADAIGGWGTATVHGSPLYGQSASGWSTKGFTYPANQVYYFGASSVTNLNSTSTTLLGYISVAVSPVKGALMAIEGNGGAAEAVAMVSTSADAIAYDCGASATGSVALGTTVHPFVLKYDRTNSKCNLYTEQENISVGFVNSINGFGIPLGSAPSFFASSRHTAVYYAGFQGAAAELTDAQVRTLLQTLGWTVAW